jgi:hypothetical protein
MQETRRRVARRELSFPDEMDMYSSTIEDILYKLVNISQTVTLAEVSIMYKLKSIVEGAKVTPVSTLANYWPIIEVRLVDGARISFLSYRIIKGERRKLHMIQHGNWAFLAYGDILYMIKPRVSLMTGALIFINKDNPDFINQIGTMLGEPADSIYTVIEKASEHAESFARELAERDYDSISFASGYRTEFSFHIPSRKLGVGAEYYYLEEDVWKRYYIETVIDGTLVPIISTDGKTLALICSRVGLDIDRLENTYREFRGFFSNGGKILAASYLIASVFNSMLLNN